MIKVFDNILTPSYAHAIEYEVHNLHYGYSVQTSTKNITYNGPILDDSNTYDCGQLECFLASKRMMHPPHPFYEQLKPLVFAAQDLLSADVKIKGVNRCKVNLLWQKESFPEHHYNIVHQDADDNSISMVYYCNDSDGYTYMFNEFYEDGVLPEKLTVADRIEPKKNRLVVFDSKRYHASANPRTNRERIVINFVLDVEE